MHTETKNFFSETKQTFERLLQDTISCFGEKTPLRDACEYALMNGGKRIRPLIVYMVGEALNQQRDVAAVALSIEYFHTASLIVDDLPCMDNDDFRREKPSLHKAFGEATAILASYALMTAGFEKIYAGAKELSHEAGNACLIALYEVSRASGIHGATGGQYLDLYSQEISVTKLLSIIEKKTVRLFEIAFLYGWIFGGGDFSYIENIKTLGFHFGMAFQIADDLRDYSEDHKRKSSSNIALHLGQQEAKDLFQHHVLVFSNLLEQLNIRTESFVLLESRLKQHADGK